jgi:inosose dehydratase
MIKIANAPCSWGVLEFDLDGKATTYVQVLDEMAAAGYAGTELGDWGFLPVEPVALRQELQARGLALLGAFVPVSLKDPAAHAGGVEAAVRTDHLLAGAAQGTANEAPLIVLADENGKNPYRTQRAGRIAPEDGLGEGAWAAFAEGADRIAAAVRMNTGLRTVFHHHCAGFIETPGEIDRLMTLTDPSLLGLCLDTGHALFGGGDPLALLRRHAARVWHVHFKDCQPEIAARSRREGWDYFTSVRQGVFCKLGEGAVDFPAMQAELEHMAYPGWIVVEQDVLPGMGSPKASAEWNRRYLSSIGL